MKYWDRQQYHSDPQIHHSPQQRSAGQVHEIAAPIFNQQQFQNHCQRQHDFRSENHLKTQVRPSIPNPDLQQYNHHQQYYPQQPPGHQDPHLRRLDSSYKNFRSEDLIENSCRKQRETEIWQGIEKKMEDLIVQMSFFPKLLESMETLPKIMEDVKTITMDVAQMKVEIMSSLPVSIVEDIVQLKADEHSSNLTAEGSPQRPLPHLPSKDRTECCEYSVRDLQQLNNQYHVNEDQISILQSPVTNPSRISHDQFIKQLEIKSTPLLFATINFINCDQPRGEKTQLHFIKQVVRHMTACRENAKWGLTTMLYPLSEAPRPPPKPPPKPLPQLPSTSPPKPQKIHKWQFLEQVIGATTLDNKIEENFCCRANKEEKEKKFQGHFSKHVAGALAIFTNGIHLLVQEDPRTSTWEHKLQDETREETLRIDGCNSWEVASPL